ncbi:uncharacterized protein MONBRDRAFT_37798 [Monosiga brevicollis MX1]|uniref:Uncharacterized protein n=1 Tax=Monosiga brevicollis TaxID=81824 RepID=A9V3G5_MONBE|nr:uncharacterized protein MONBRDRAFT_37798 [Monosiga brevicollis MX1]EDQ87908.1 predicted protein [Monosiga brevicollis MX1]|eukprot:XP_001747441.1 hypothetical protein [Monosiga brevicollis MX1]
MENDPGLTPVDPSQEEALLEKLDKNGITFFQQLRRKKKDCMSAILALRAELAECEQRIQEEQEKLGIEDDGLDRKAILNRGIVIFNEKPNKGIAYLTEENYFEAGGTAHEVAEFLSNTSDLTKQAIGDYLGENKEFNLAVLDEFVGLHSFHDLNFDTALRRYLWSFRLPGESQKIDRMMETFAKHYCQANPNVFHSTDGGFILAFATIMLNTSLHNPSVAHKPSLDEFVSMNRGIDEGKDIDRPLLEEIYASIAKTPFKIPDDDEGLSIMFFNPAKSGYLKKEGGTKKTWKDRWVVLKDSCLYYFRDKDDESPSGIIPLLDVRAHLVADDKGKKAPKGPGFFFELVGADDGMGGTLPIKGCKTNSKGMVVQGNHDRYLFRAETQHEAEEWVHGIMASVTRQPFFSMRRHSSRSGLPMAEATP